MPLFPMSARTHRILTLVGVLLTAGSTIVSALATQGVLAPTLATTLGGALTALVTVLREAQDPSNTPVTLPRTPPAPPA